MKILAIAAHPDDIEFLCAGTLALLRQRGHSIALATVANGGCGSATLTPAEIACVRAEEAGNAAAVLDAEYYGAGVDDLEIVFSNDIRRQAVEILRITRPDMIITHFPEDYMLDHEITSKIARDAAFSASVPNYPTHAENPAPPTAKIPHLYYMSPLDGITIFGKPVEFQFVIDISSVMDTKVEMLGCHASQRAWLQRQHGMDEYVEHMKRNSAGMGRRQGYEFGEGFCQHLGHAYPGDNLLAKLLEG